MKTASKNNLATGECVCVCFCVCVVYSRAACPLTVQAAFLVRRPPPIFGWGWALKHVWNSWIETDRETETERLREAKTFYIWGVIQVRIWFETVRSERIGKRKKISDRIRNDIKSRTEEEQLESTDWWVVLCSLSITTSNFLNFKSLSISSNCAVALVRCFQVVYIFLLYCCYFFLWINSFLWYFIFYIHHFAFRLASPCTVAQKKLQEYTFLSIQSIVESVCLFIRFPCQQCCFLCVWHLCGIKWLMERAICVWNILWAGCNLGTPKLLGTSVGW